MNFKRRWTARHRSSEEPFFGWRMVALCAIIFGMTAPGQTNLVSVFIDPMIGDLDVTRSQISTAYLIGTLVGALGLKPIGRAIDRHGPRRVMMATTVALFLVLIGMANVTGLVTMTIGFVGIRLLGQGGLTLASTTLPAAWFEKRRGSALGFTIAVGGALISLFPVAVAALFAIIDWRQAWFWLGLATVVVVLPLAKWWLIDRPEDVGQQVDGGQRAQAEGSDFQAIARPISFTAPEALRTRAFWAVTLGGMSVAMTATGMAFHQISLLGEQGLSSLEGAANFLPQTAASMLITVGAGAMLDRFKPRYLLIANMLIMAAAMISVGYVQPGITAIIYGLFAGAYMAMSRLIEAASMPKFFGLAHIGEIRGIVKAGMVGSSAFGPLLLSIGYDFFGSYRQVLAMMLIMPVAVILLSLSMSQPVKPGEEPI